MSPKIPRVKRRSAGASAVRSVSRKSIAIDRRSNRKNAAASARNAPSRVTRSKKSRLLSLNDDCISNILSHLDLADLFALNDSCRYLNSLVYMEVQQRYRTNEYVCLQVRKDANAAILLRKFGRFITHLCIDGENSFFDRCGPYKGDWNRYDDGCDFATMMKDCKSLRSLKFQNVSLRNFPVREMRNIFRNVETLEIEHCSGVTQKIASLLRVSKKLKHLVVKPSDDTVEPSDLFSAAHGFGKDVETIRLKMDSTYEAPQFLNFLKRLQELEKLRTLELGLIWEYPLTNRIINALASIDSMEKLILRRFIPNAEFFRESNRFRKLEVCELHTDESVSDAKISLAADFIITMIKNESNRSLDDLEDTQAQHDTKCTIILVRKK